MLLDHVFQGNVLYLSGPFSENEFFASIPERKSLLELKTTIKRLNREEPLYIEGTAYPVTFGDLNFNWVDKEVITGDAKQEFTVIPHGMGTILWSPLPLELSDSFDVLEEAYNLCIKKAGIQRDFTWLSENISGAFGKKMKFETGSLYIFVSETSEDSSVQIEDLEHACRYSFTLPNNRAVLFSINRDGDVTHSYANFPVQKENL